MNIIINIRTPLMHMKNIKLAKYQCDNSTVSEIKISSDILENPFNAGAKWN